MRAISIKQPWVEQILKGIKAREYRSKPTKITGRVYLYASLKELDDDADWKKVGKKRGELPTGRIVGTVEIKKCVRSGDGFAYVLEKPKRIRKFPKHKNQPQPCFWIPRF
jgi:hypothetical protein